MRKLFQPHLTDINQLRQYTDNILMIIYKEVDQEMDLEIIDSLIVVI